MLDECVFLPFIRKCFILFVINLQKGVPYRLDIAVVKDLHDDSSCCMIYAVKYVCLQLLCFECNPESTKGFPNLES